MDICKNTTELSYAICAVTFLQNKPKEGEILLRMLLEENFGLHHLLFDFSEQLNELSIIQTIIQEYN